jgi:hypothetical protein
VIAAETIIGNTGHIFDKLEFGSLKTVASRQASVHQIQTGANKWQRN